MLRKWVKVSSSKAPAASPSVTFYDAGDYWGEHYADDSWICYKVISRQRTAEGIEEQLERMYEDFVPWDVFSTESYPVLEKTDSTLAIPGWRLTTVQ
jgi:hypothetical protein